MISVDLLRRVSNKKGTLIVSSYPGCYRFTSAKTRGGINQRCTGETRLRHENKRVQHTKHTQ